MAFVHQRGLGAEQKLIELLSEVSMMRLVDWTCEDWFGNVHAEIADFETADDAVDWAFDGQDPAVLLDGYPEEYIRELWRELNDED